MTAEPSPPAAQEASARPSSFDRIMRWARIILGIATVVIVGLIGLGTWLESGKLPGCDSTRARDTLSDAFKQNNIQAASYTSINTVSSNDKEVSCTAELALRDGSALIVDYRFYHEGETVMYQMSQRRRLN